MNSHDFHPTNTALVDKGVLRTILRVGAEGIFGGHSKHNKKSAEEQTFSILDLGSLDGQYAKWLNDTGIFDAFAVDGVNGVTALTDGRVTQGDLTKDLSKQLPPWLPFLWSIGVSFSRTVLDLIYHRCILSEKDQFEKERGTA